MQQELQQELDRLHLASQRSAENLRERLRRLRSRDASHRRLLSGEEGELQVGAEVMQKGSLTREVASSGRSPGG